MIYILGLVVFFLGLCLIGGLITEIIWKVVTKNEKYPLN